ncbi:Wzz/FepE/Etk N-terminal domain-containing protein [Methylobacterium sp. CB376]|uniref:GumC family protein n=1 Tax=unclassified Methylobacterium TaxID=2615210 RepID=UPI0012379D4E|nr:MULTISPECIES: Wzz/FepE/Etk N-terminal domain-containing protein [Methylobacterium]WFT81685.1 Wzz/FepE/Etk N-terminal domain-containing protein [Methylobacterium nodulans]
MTVDQTRSTRMSLQASRLTTQLPILRDRGVNLREILSVLKRRRAIFLVVTSIVLFSVIAYLFIARPTFTATAQILLDQQQRIADDVPREQLPSETVSAIVESQVQTVASHEIVRRLIASEHLTSDPEFASRGLVLQILHSALGMIGTAAYEEGDPEARVHQNVRNAISARRLDKTFVLEISFESHDRQKSARLANATARAFIADQVEAKVAANRRLAASYEARLPELRGELQRAEQAIETYKFQHSTVVPSGGPATLGGNEALVGLRELEREAETSRALYVSQLARSRKAFEQANFYVADARFISPAIPPARRSWPPTGVLLVAGLFGGMSVAAGVALLRDHLDTRLFTKEQTESETEFPVLADIPEARPNSPDIARCNQGAFLRILDSVREHSERKSTRIILLTSSELGEGKSTIAINLAMIADKLGDSVLLVDSPFATTATSVAGEHIWFVDSPFIVRAALLPSSAGIKATSQNGEAAHRQAAHHPLVLQGDSARRTSLRDQIEFLLNSSTRKFDLIILERSAANDDCVLRDMSHIAHSIIIVAKAGRTRVGDIASISETLGLGRKRIAGVVLNRTRRKSRLLP